MTSRPGANASGEFPANNSCQPVDGMLAPKKNYSPLLIAIYRKLLDDELILGLQYLPGIGADTNQHVVFERQFEKKDHGMAPVKLFLGALSGKTHLCGRVYAYSNCEIVFVPPDDEPGTISVESLFNSLDWAIPFAWVIVKSVRINRIHDNAEVDNRTPTTKRTFQRFVIPVIQFYFHVWAGMKGKWNRLDDSLNLDLLKGALIELFDSPEYEEKKRSGRRFMSLEDAWSIILTNVGLNDSNQTLKLLEDEKLKNRAMILSLREREVEIDEAIAKIREGSLRQTLEC
ncbi:hypothetical protein B0J11DRAFT_583827 [Dendryphion nanum]|uniref:Uncharacterized protein n=1 Tax=Dendryphion nanum TaxID=256645 RepID=A0A9P9DDV5_9PLEO|nr:hypothetical protein B0J11DRAFT_583827 [Dendryphion nanum]